VQGVDFGFDGLAPEGGDEAEENGRYHRHLSPRPQPVAQAKQQAGRRQPIDHHREV